MSKSKTYQIKGHYIDPYSWKVIPLDTTVNIGSKADAISWAKQTYNKCQVNIIERVKK